MGHTDPNGHNCITFELFLLCVCAYMRAETALFTDATVSLSLVVSHIVCVSVCVQGEASRQQDGQALYQGGPQLLSRRQSLETQYLSHRLQVTQ